MAVTITVNPNNYSPATNPLVFEFTSTETAQTAFSFYVELTINGAVHSYHDIYPESSNTGKFDCSEILRSYVTSQLVPDGSLEVPYTNAIATYTIRVRDKYGDPPALQGTYATTSTLKTFNAALGHVDWISYDYNTYDITTQSDNDYLFLSTFPRTRDYFCGLSESTFVACFVTDTSADFSVTLYDTTGASIASDTGVTLSLPTNDLLLLDISPTNIVNNTAITDANFSTCYYYEVRVSATGGGIEDGLSELWRVYIDTECSLYASKRLIWLDRLSGFESMSFTKYSQEQAQVTSNSYERTKGTWDASNNWVYNRSTGQRKTASKRIVETLTINSDWIKEDVQQWLVQSLHSSPLVYLEVSEGVFEIVKVTGSSYRKKQRVKDRLIQETITLERTYTYRSQLG